MEPQDSTPSSATLLAASLGLSLITHQPRGGHTAERQGSGCHGPWPLGGAHSTAAAPEHGPLRGPLPSHSPEGPSQAGLQVLAAQEPAGGLTTIPHGALTIRTQVTAQPAANSLSEDRDCMFSVWVWVWDGKNKTFTFSRASLSRSSCTARSLML